MFVFFHQTETAYVHYVFRSWDEIVHQWVHEFQSWSHKLRKYLSDQNEICRGGQITVKLSSNLTSLWKRNVAEDHFTIHHNINSILFLLRLTRGRISVDQLLSKIFFMTFNFYLHESSKPTSSSLFFWLTVDKMIPYRAQQICFFFYSVLHVI